MKECRGKTACSSRSAVPFFTAGNVSSETIKHSIEARKREELHDARRSYPSGVLAQAVEKPA